MGGAGIRSKVFRIAGFRWLLLFLELMHIKANGGSAEMKAISLRSSLPTLSSLGLVHFFLPYFFLTSFICHYDND